MFLPIVQIVEPIYDAGKYDGLREQLNCTSERRPLRAVAGGVGTVSVIEAVRAFITNDG
jgi:hypothetical protein